MWFNIEKQLCYLPCTSKFGENPRRPVGSSDEVGSIFAASSSRRKISFGKKVECCGYWKRGKNGISKFGVVLYVISLQRVDVR